MMKIRNYLFLCLILTAACSGSPDIEIPEKIAALENLTVIEANAEPIHSIDLRQEAVFGDTDEVIIGSMGPFFVDHLGRVYIIDYNQNVLHAYREDGSYLAQIGREGDGPGEFRRINAVRMDDQHLHVMDTSAMRISRFALETFKFADNIPIPFEMEPAGGYISYPGNFYILGDDRYLIHFGTGYTSVMDDSEAEPKEHGRVFNGKIGEFEEGFVYEFPISEAIVHREGGSMSVMSTDYKRRSSISVGGNQFVHGWSEDLLFTFYDIDGTYRKAFWQPYEKPALNRNEILNQYAEREEPWRGMIRNDDMPDTWPAYSTMLMDDENRVWTALFTDNEETYDWRVYTDEGEFLATFSWPRSKTISEVKNGLAYTRETDEETGLQQVVRYRIEFNEMN
jgi:hypothetical protein